MSGPPFTTVFAAKRALVDLIAALPEFQGVQVTYGHPGVNLERELLYVGNVPTMDTKFATTNARSREETYDLELVLNLRTPGQSEREQDARAEVLLAAVARALKTVPSGTSLNGSLPGGWSSFRPHQVVYGSSTESFETEVRCVVTCVARV